MLILPNLLAAALGRKVPAFYGTDRSVFYADFRSGRVWDPGLQAERTVADILSNTRAGNAWVPQADGTDLLIPANGIPRSDLGLLPFESRQNFLASPDTPATQTVSLTAGTYTCWCRGTGTVTITGTFSTPPGGMVSEGNWQKFTLSATQSITFTVAGTPNFFQCEKGSFPTPGIHAQATRAIDLLTAIGPLLAALQRNESTIYFEWQEPSATDLPAANRRLVRASNGTTTVFTTIINSAEKLNASHTVGGTIQFSITITASVVNGTLNAAYVVLKQDNFRTALAGVELQADNSGSVNMSGISNFVIGRRDDTATEAFNAAITRIIIWPRALPDSQLVPFDGAASVPPPYVEYDAIETDGGAAGTLLTRSDFGTTGSSTLTNWLRGTSARKIVTDPALQGVEPANPTVVQIEGGQLSWRGHKHYIAAFGGNIVLGGDTTTETTDVVLEDLHLLPGDGAIGRNPDDRDALGLWSGRRVIFRNCVFAYSIDEALGGFQEGGFPIRDVLFEYCIFGPTLKNAVVNGSPAKPNEPLHNFGLLSSSYAMNMVVRYCLFAGNRQRSPDFVIPFGHVFQNNLVYNVSNIASAVWGSDLLSDKLSATAAIRNNLYKAGPQSPSDWLDRCQVLGRIDKNSAVYFGGNYGTDGVTFSADTALAPDRVYLRNGATKASLVPAMPFGTPYDPMPTATTQNRQDLWNYVMDRIGVRTRDGNDDIVPGDADASPFSAAVIAAVKNGTLNEITTPSDFVGYLYT
jgi:hypothetical protein